MQIKILGTRGEIEEKLPRYRRQSAILIDKVLMIDIGEKSFLKFQPKWILITHFHPDHAYFVRKKQEEVPKTKAKLFAPEKIKKVRVIKVKKKLGPFTITPLPTHHSKYVKSQAYYIQRGQKSILITGDLIWLNKIYLHRLKKKIDLVITEASFIKEGGMIRKDKETGQIYGHNGVPNLIRLFAPYTKKILFTHFGSWFFKNPNKSKKKLLELGKKYDIPIDVAFDGKNLNI